MVGAVVLATQGSVVPALADGTGEPFLSSNCNYYERPVGAQFDKSTGEPTTEAWQITRLAPEAAWKVATGKGVKVAVIDTGVDTVDMDDYLSSPRVQTFNYAGYDKTASTSTLYDCTHGTKVVSLLAARRSEASDANFSGIAPDAQVLAYRSLQLSEAKEGDLEPFEPTINAIDRAIRDRVRVINISQSAPGDNAGYRAAIKRAIDAGIVVVAAAGNGGAIGASYPAAYPGVIAVAMTTSDDSAAELSQWGDGMSISVAAPGDKVMALLPSNKQEGLSYSTEVSGTSFAAPLVSGVVALMLQKDPDLTPAEVKLRLEQSADPPAGTIPDPKLGYGIVNPYRALTMVPSGAATETASPTPVEPPLPEHLRPKPDELPRIVALVIAGVVIAGALLGAVVRFTLPAARKRLFRPASPTPRPPAKE